MKQINMQQFDNLISGEKPVVCDFYADWCRPCKMLAPILEKLSSSYSDKAEFVKVNIDAAPELSARYGIMSIPFVAVFNGGDMIARSVGYITEDEAKNFLDENL